MRTVRVSGIGVFAAAVTLGVLAGGCDSGGQETEGTPFKTPAGVQGDPTEVEGAVTYSFTDSNQDSLIYVQVFAVPGTQGHDHVMRASGYTGSLTWDSANPSACALEVTLDVIEIKVDEDAMRHLVGYTATMKENQKETVRNNMLDEDQLDQAHYPTMHYAATGCTESGGEVTLTGDLTIHGVTRSVSTKFTPTLTTEGLYATATLNITHRQFGIEPYKLTSLYENQDEIPMTFVIHGIPPQ